jgi:hypothetical protein
MDLPKRGD